MQTRAQSQCSDGSRQVDPRLAPAGAMRNFGRSGRVSASMKPFLLAVGVVLTVAGAALVGTASPSPFRLELRPVTPIVPSSPDDLPSAIRAQTDVEGGAGVPPAVLDEWSRLLGGVVYRDQAALNRLPAPGGDSLAVPLPFAAPGGVNRANAEYLAESEDAYRRLVLDNLGALGMTLESLHFMSVEGIPVPVVRARAANRLLERSGSVPLGYSVFAGGYDEHLSLGWYVDVLDEHGAWVQSQGLVPAGGSGSFDSAVEDADACGGPVVCVAHG